MELLALLLVAVIGLVSPAHSEQKVISQFMGLNTNESSAIIGDNEASDLLNTDITPGGRSVKKRPGYGLYKTLGTAKAIHGGHHFYNSGGSDVQLWGSSTSLYGITSDATPVQIVSSATLNSTWDCADTQGFAYCATTGRDLLLKTDGASITQWMTSPLGTMVTVTPDRLVVAGVSGARNTLYFSQQNTFNNFTTGINETDPFTEVIAAPGAAITHITWGCQKLLWWKNSSFGYINGSNQFDLSIVTVNDSIGTVDNSSSIDPGGTVWFRGQDGHLYSYDCSALIKESIDITPLAQASGNRTANSWNITSQSDFETGTSSPTSHLSFTMSPGNVVVSSFGHTATTTADWLSGAIRNNLGAASGSLSLTTNNSGNVTDGGFEVNPITTYWTVTSGDGTPTSIVSVDGDNCGLISANSGTRFASFPGGESLIIDASVVSLDGNTVYDGTSVSGGVSCGYSPYTITMSAANIGKRFRMQFKDRNSATKIISKDSYILGGDITFRATTDRVVGTKTVFIDTVLLGSSTIDSGNFASLSFDTGVSSSIAYSSASWTVNTSTPSFVLQTSSDESTWRDVTTSTGINVNVNRYIRYLSTITASGTDNALSTLDEVTLVSRSSGTYYSAVKNAPLLTAWDTFTANKQDNGYSQVFYTRSSTTLFLAADASPSWTLQPVGALVSVSTGTYFQVRSDFAITAATQNPTLNDFTVNWFEGTASDKVYSIYFDNAIWWSLAYGEGQSSNNYIFRFDLINKGWLLYDIGTGGMIQQGQYLYFGSTTTSANTYKYGSGTSDNGTAITAYYKSKDFMGGDPWLENQYKQMDTYYKANQNNNLTVSYFLNTSTTSTSYTVNLSSNTQSVIRNKKLLPNGKIGGNLSVKFGDTSDSSEWELLGYRFLYDVLPYRPTNP